MINMHKNNFTFTELTVIACTLVLFCLLAVPTIGSIRQHGENVECLGKLRVLGENILAYSDDYDRITPDSYYDRKSKDKRCLVSRPLNYTRIGTVNRFGIAMIAYNYMNSPEPLICPASGKDGEVFAKAYKKWRTAPEPYNSSSPAAMSYPITYPRRIGKENFALAADNWINGKRYHIEKVYHTVFADGSAKARSDADYLGGRASSESLFDLIYIMGGVLAPEHDIIKQQDHGSYKKYANTCLYLQKSESAEKSH